MGDVVGHDVELLAGPPVAEGLEQVTELAVALAVTDPVEDLPGCEVQGGEQVQHDRLVTPMPAAHADCWSASINVRELADTQFRFVPGHLGAGTVSLRSVNFPDRHVRVVQDGVPRIDPFADTDAYGRATSFLREPGLADRSAVSPRLSTEHRAYLAHDGNGRLVVARPGRDRTEPSAITCLFSSSRFDVSV